MKKALITGITGQDGSYLAEFLLKKGYEIHGLIRRASTFNTDRIDHLYKDFHDPEARVYLHYGDLSVSGQLMDMLHDIKPDEVYHLGAQSHVRVSFDMPEYTGDVTGLGTLRLIEAIRKTGIPTRFYQASSSEMFGHGHGKPSETIGKALDVGIDCHSLFPVSEDQIFGAMVTEPNNDDLIVL